jgi:hypothetical protein
MIEAGLMSTPTTSAPRPTRLTALPDRREVQDTSTAQGLHPVEQHSALKIKSGVIPADGLVDGRDVVVPEVALASLLFSRGHATT